MSKLLSSLNLRFLVTALLFTWSSLLIVVVVSPVVVVRALTVFPKRISPINGRFSQCQTLPFDSARYQQQQSTTLLSSPSDSRSSWDEYDYDDEIVDIEETSSGSDDDDSVLAGVNNLMDMLPRDVNADLSDDVRAAINEALYKLEKLAPSSSTTGITASPLINGVWELKYVSGGGNGGLTGGGLLSVLKSVQKSISARLPPNPLTSSFSSSSPPPSLVEFTNVQVTIARSQPRAEAAVQFRVAGNDRLGGTAIIVARLDTMSDVRLRETFQSVSFSLPSILSGSNSGSSSSSSSNTQPIDLPDILQYERDLYVTYVDEDLLIIRDVNGAAEVLVRQSKVFSGNWGTEPSDYSDDMVPPGQQ